MKILLLSNSDYLSGLFKGYSLNIGCEINTISDCNNFYETLHKKPPVLAFIDMAQIPQLIGMPEWQETLRFIELNNIILCGFGHQLFDNMNHQPNSAFKKMFPAPINDDEILLYMQETLVKNELLKKERRNHERRAKLNRRSSTTQIHASPPSDQQENFKLGALTLNRPHKTITINDIPIALSHKEFEIIDYLVKNSGYVVKTEDIIKNIWAKCSTATKADVHQYVHLLRKKIEEDPHNPKLLVTVKGVGYELCP